MDRPGLETAGRDGCSRPEQSRSPELTLPDRSRLALRELLWAQLLSTA